MQAFLGFQLSTQLPDTLSSQKTVCLTINPHSFCVAKTDRPFQRALLESDMLLPDGIGIVYATRFLYGQKITRISGSDLHLHMLELLQRQGGGRVFYLGAAQQTLDKIQARIRKEYPALTVETYSPPYKAVFSAEENADMIRRVNAAAPDVLFVGMTAPKQEKWIMEHQQQLQVPFMAAIGAVFDFYAGTVKRPGPFWIKAGLEWLPRLVQEPKRLWRRTFISTPEFLWEVLKVKLTR
ncbi:MAG: WecB/TagA/CpsF family glycosyltransferase [Nitritalea sp.]